MRSLAAMGFSLFGLLDCLYIEFCLQNPHSSATRVANGCDLILHSSYSGFRGYPLPVLGILMYSCVSVLFAMQPLVNSGIRYFVGLLSGTIISIGVTTSCYLTWIEFRVLKTWCPWTLACASTTVILGAICTFDVLADRKKGTDQLKVLKAEMAILGLAFLVAIIGFASLDHAPASASISPELPLDVADSLTVVRPWSHSQGSSDAPIKIVEFADIQCPACRTEEGVIKQILNKYSDRVDYIFRQFPLLSVHPNAMHAAEATECADEQQMFWPARGKLYEEQGDLSDSAVEQYMAAAGIDLGKFRKCMLSRRKRSRVADDIADGKALGVRSTPTFFVNGHMIVGAVPLSEFSSLIEHELANSEVKGKN
jgi:protein-disulfide isomerase/uncharacterized membrane protein